MRSRVLRNGNTEINDGSHDLKTPASSSADKCADPLRIRADCSHPPADASADNREEGSADPSSPSILYTLPYMTYSNESARDGIPTSCGAHSPASAHPSSRSVVTSTSRNLSASSMG